jgi:uncharacterized repeat protein (TIGR03803 family)
VFQVNPASRVTPVYSFKGGSDGSALQAGVIGDSAGNLYGVTEGGGPGNAGVVFKFNSAGQETVIVQLHQWDRWVRSLRSGDPQCRGQRL